MAKTADNLELLSRAGSVRFSDLIFELLSEQAPSQDQSRIFELLLNLAIDHGPETPSTLKVIEAAKSSKLISESVAAGVLGINNEHGGAAEPLMEILYQVKGGNLTVKSLVENTLKEGKKLPGFGHRIYKDKDPRAELIVGLLQKSHDRNEFVEITSDIQRELEKQTGKQLPLNIDGAIAVALCSFGWEPKLGKAVFIIARTPGLCAHYLNNS